MNTVVLSPRRGSRWPWLMAGLLLAFAAAFGLAWAALQSMQGMPISVVADGQRVFDDVDLAALHPGHLLTLAALAALALLATMVVLPVALLLTLLCVVVGVLVTVLATVGLPLLVAGLLVAVLLSPLWLGVWLLLKLLA